MDLPVNWSNIYEAYLPTVIRDMVYGIARNYCPISAPFNEWRGYLLQSKGQELTFQEFFKPSNFIRSTSLGAIKQGLALAVGYWCAPPATHFVRGLVAAIK